METTIIYPLSWLLVIGAIVLLIGIVTTNSLMDFVLNNFGQIVCISVIIIVIITAITIFRSFNKARERRARLFLLIPANLFALSQFLFSFYSCMETVNNIPDVGLILFWRIIVFFILGCYSLFNVICTVLATAIPMIEGVDTEDINVILYPTIYGAAGWLIILIAFLLGKWI